MDLFSLIAPTGILSFVLFATACINGIPRLRLLRYHAVTGYACCTVVLAHSVIAVLCQVIEPVGVLATTGMVLTTVSGFLRWRLWLHVLLTGVTLLASVGHVVFILWLR
jgi:hypothetical protein